MVLRLSLLLLVLLRAEVIYIPKGGSSEIDCQFDGTEQLLRIEAKKQLLFIKIINMPTQEVAPNKHPWKLLNGNSSESSIKIAIENMDQSMEDVLNCQNEKGDQKTFETKMLVRPKVEVSSQSKGPLRAGDIYQAECLASGGVPMVNIKWSTSTGIIIPANMSVEEGTMTSRINYELDASLDGESIRCLIEQRGSSQPYPLPAIALNFPPSAVRFDPPATFTEGDYISAQCTAKGKPVPKISYEMAVKEKPDEFSPFNPKTTALTVAVDAAKIRCRAQNRLNATFGESIVIRVTQKPTKSVASTPRSTTKKVTTTATSNGTPSDPQQFRKDDSQTTAQTDSDLAIDVQKSGPRGIILSIVGVSCFLGFVIFLFFIRRCLKDRQGESYKTDEMCTDEGVSLHDPELEAHKKKEYFM